jgi:hypothetical protein
MLAATRIRVDWIALLAGIALAAVAAVGLKVDGGVEVPPAEVTILTAPSQDLAVVEGSNVIETRELRPATSDEGFERRMTVRNATGGTLAVGFRAETATKDLDGALRVRIQADDQTIFEGTLTELRAGSSESFHLASHATSSISVLAWIPFTADEQTWKARGDQVRIEFLTTPTLP